MSLVKARPPLTPTADHCRRPSTPMPKELTLVVSWREHARHGTGLQERVGERILRDVGQRLDHLGADRARDARAIGLQQRRVGGDVDRLTELADGQLDAMRTVSVAPTAMPVRLKVAKPESVTVTV